MKIIYPVDDQEIELLAYTSLTEEGADYNAVTPEGLEKLYLELTLQSWKCFGLKLAVPLLPLLACGGAILMLLHSFLNKTDEVKVRDVSVSILTGAAGMGLFTFGLKQAKVLHQQQKSIDEKREQIALDICSRSGFV